MNCSECNEDKSYYCKKCLIHVHELLHGKIFVIDILITCPHMKDKKDKNGMDQC